MSVRISKFLSLVLRHEPERVGIALDEAGWTDVEALLAAASAHGVAITRAQLAEIVATSDKQRTLRRRAELVLAVAAHHGAERLVLGAWGAGVFGNDPEMVARAFADPLRGTFAGAFAEIVFAVPDPAGANHRAFAAIFG